MKFNHNKYKLIALDMDCTLLNDEKKVSPRNKEALKKAMEKGIKIVLATARVYPSARHYAKQLNFQTPIIACNGSLIKDEATGETLYKVAVPEDVNLRFIQLSREKGLHCQLFTYDSIYSEKLINAAYRYNKYNEYMGEKDKVNILIVDNMEDIAKKEEIFQMVLEDNDEKAMSYVRNSMCEMDNATIIQSSSKNLEAVHKGVSKGAALKILSELYGIERESIIAMGDYENDITMIEYAGLGVAMGNASEGLKAKADYITGNHNDDGVAQVIEKFVL